MNRNYIKRLADYHNCPLGLLEMAIGATMMGIGAVTLTPADVSHVGAGIGAASGAAGGLGLGFMGNMGLVALGSGVLLPWYAVAGAGALLLGAAGYAVGDVTDILTTAQSHFHLLGGLTLFAAGLALFIDGARRLLRDTSVYLVLKKIRRAVYDFVVAVKQMVFGVIHTIITTIVDIVRRIFRFLFPGQSGEAC